jgi:type IV pilus assembly protein PilB
LQKDEDSFQWEIRTAGSTAGEQVLAKRLESFNIMRTKDIGMTAEQIESVAKNRDLNKGLFIISGTKKSGATSTLYAMLKNHDPFMNDINTLEKRPAGEVEHVTQHHFKMSDSGTTSYDQRLRAISRMGPNIMGVGDCEDAKTAGECIQALEEDKLMYVVIEASSVVTALGKWFKYIPDREMVIDNLIGVCNQRMVRKLCDECKQAYQPNPKLVKKFGLAPEKAKVLYREGEIEYDKRGKPRLCEKCQSTGFHGRTGVFELIIFDDKLKAAVKSAKSLQEISALFRRRGMVCLQEQSMLMVTDGITSINEVVREFSTGKTKPTDKKKK